MTEKREMFVPIGAFDSSRIRISSPKANSFTKNKKTVTWYTSDGFYLDDEGKESEAYFELPEQYTFGFNPNYTFGVDENDRTDDDLKGWQVCYNLASMKTVDDPTENEQYARRIFEELHNAAVQTFIDECSKPKKDRKAPTVSVGSYLDIMNDSEKDRDWNDGVKFPFSWPYKEGTKTLDMTKPPRAYIKLMTSGSGKNLRVNTEIRGPGHVKKSPSSYEGVRGTIHPVVKFVGLYWGQHGPDNPQGCSIKLQLAQCKYTPGSDAVASRFFLGTNDAKEIDEGEETPPGDFTHPGGKDKEPEGFEEEKKSDGSEGEKSSEEKEESEEEKKPKVAPRRTTGGKRRLKRRAK